MRLLIGDSGKKAAAVLAVAFFTLCLLTVVGCGNGTGKDNGKATKSDSQQATNGYTWINTNGGVSSYAIQSLVYDSSHNLLYAGTNSQGAWKYDGHHLDRHQWRGLGLYGLHPRLRLGPQPALWGLL